MRRAGVAGAAPPVDADKQEQPDHVDEVPVPSRRLEADVLLRREVARTGAQEANQEEAGPDEHVKTVEAGGHEEGRRIDAVAETERGVAVLVGLAAQRNRMPSTTVTPSQNTVFLRSPARTA